MSENNKNEIDNIKRGRTPKNQKMGRPTKFEPEVAETILTYIKAGSYVETAAVAAGISKETFYEWLRRGAKWKEGKSEDPNDEQYANFSDAVKQAQARSELHDLMIIGKASAKQWTAAAWRLERKHPDRWGRKEKQDVVVQGTQFIGTASIPPSDIKEYQERLSRFFASTDEQIMFDESDLGDDSGESPLEDVD